MADLRQVQHLMKQIKESGAVWIPTLTRIYAQGEAPLEITLRTEYRVGERIASVLLTMGYSESSSEDGSSYPVVTLTVNACTDATGTNKVNILSERFHPESIFNYLKETILSLPEVQVAIKNLQLEKARQAEVQKEKENEEDRIRAQFLGVSENRQEQSVSSGTSGCVVPLFVTMTVFGWTAVTIAKAWCE